MNEALLHQLQHDIQTQRDTSRPFVIQSLGMSLDGTIATYTGDSKYISGTESRQWVHQLRHLCDGILVGIHTIEIDHPHLTTRLVSGRGKDAHRIILDSHLKISLDEPILHLSSTARTLILTTTTDSPKQALLEQLGAVVLVCQTNSQGRIDLTDALSQLRHWGIRSLLVEGGSTVHFAFLEAHLVDYAFYTLSPLIIGGDTAKTAGGGQGFATLQDAIRFTHLDVFPLGVDYVFHGRILK
jgi:diaminohydroxyphosphoribosylaminopyrimidine deaminase/5-amino-6-(5-phosphoribosylamino)uracil reductase